MSLSVLVDQGVRFEGTGAQQQRVLVPIPPERLQVIRNLVAATTGFTQTRGDQLIVESLPFESTMNMEAPGQSPGAPASGNATPPTWLEQLKQNQMLVAIGAVGTAIVLFLIRGLIWLIRRKGKGEAAATLPATLPAAPEPGTGQMDQVALSRQLSAAPPARAEVLSREIRETVAKEPAAAAQNVRKWLSEERA
jgi:flagellar biosynthesis/type III secretory pathway M-ring protein FliF/YscJ